MEVEMEMEVEADRKRRFNNGFFGIRLSLG